MIEIIKFKVETKLVSLFISVKWLAATVKEGLHKSKLVLFYPLVMSIHHIFSFQTFLSSITSAKSKCQFITLFLSFFFLFLFFPLKRIFKKIKSYVKSVSNGSESMTCHDLLEFGHLLTIYRLEPSFRLLSMHGTCSSPPWYSFHKAFTHLVQPCS